MAMWLFLLSGIHACRQMQEIHTVSPIMPAIVCCWVWWNAICVVYTSRGKAFARLVF